jgi:hypothetical protein
MHFRFAISAMAARYRASPTAKNWFWAGFESEHFAIDMADNRLPTQPKHLRSSFMSVGPTYKGGEI